MCTPTAALGGVSAASSVLGYIGQGKRAKAQAAAQQRASAAERQRVGAESTNIRLKQGQQRIALANEMEEGARRANIARATAAVSAGESGVSGRAAELLDQDVNVQAARYNHQLQNQRSENDFAADLQGENAIIRSQQNQIRINQPIEKPNPLALVTGVIGGLAQAQTFGVNYEKSMGHSMGWRDVLGLGSQGLNIAGQSFNGTPTNISATPQQSYTSNQVYEQPRVSSDIGLPQDPYEASGALLPPLS